jgi:hypothetical protein
VEDQMKILSPFVQSKQIPLDVLTKLIGLQQAIFDLHGNRTQQNDFFYYFFFEFDLNLLFVAFISNRE